MVTITLSPDTVRSLRNVRVWGARVFAMLLIGWSVSRGMSTRPTPISPTFQYSAPALMTPTLRPSTPSIPPAPQVRRVSRQVRPSNTIMCLAQNLYFEAKNEPAEALEAVAATVFNRMEKHRSLCAVVYQPFQYSWTLDVSNWSRKPPAEFLILAAQMWSNRDILADEYPVTHFHRVDIHPRWATSLLYVGTFGQHKFYRQES